MVECLARDLTLCVPLVWQLNPIHLWVVLHTRCVHEPNVLHAGSDRNVQITCRVCETGKYLEKVALPYVFRFLSTELAAMNIKCTLSVESN